VLAAVGTAAAITFALRAGPFLALRPLRSSRLVRDLTLWMPGGLMVIVVAYLLRGTARESLAQGGLGLTALLTVVVLYWWRGSALLSILAGTALYVAVLNLVLR
jgi:branched-subunit amino acid transport protein AzlD